MAEKHLSFYTPFDVHGGFLISQEQRRFMQGKRRGITLGERVFNGVPDLLREAASMEDQVVRSGLIRGFSEKLADEFFPLPDYTGSNRSLTIAMAGAEVDYAAGAEEILTAAVNRVRPPQG